MKLCSNGLIIIIIIEKFKDWTGKVVSVKKQRRVSRHNLEAGRVGTHPPNNNNNNIIWLVCPLWKYAIPYKRTMANSVALQDRMWDRFFFF